MNNTTGSKGEMNVKTNAVRAGIRLCLVAMAIALMIDGCGQTSGDTAGGQNKTSATAEQKGSGQGGGQTGEKPLTDVAIMLDWYPNAVHSFLYTALEKGYFKDEGLNVTIEMPSDTNDPMKLVAANRVTFGMSYQPEVVMARAEGLPVVCVAAAVRQPLNIIMTPEQSGIRSPKDLAGKQLGYPSIPLDESIAKTMAANDGADPSEVKMVVIGWDIIPAIAANKVDAVIGGYINHEKLLLEKEGIAIRAFKPADYGVPNYYELVLVASEETVKNNPEVVQAFWRAAQKGQAYVANHPDEALQILLKNQEKTAPLDEDVEKQSLAILLPLMDAGDQPFGSQKEGDWAKLIQWMKENRVIDKDVKPADAFFDATK
jgi:putative hydroxymethylpyrimidine transport system substrate-binding protein